MKPRVIIALILAITPFLSGHAKPTWKAGSISQIEIWDKGFVVKRTISSSPDLESLGAGLRAAAEVASLRDGHAWTHMVDITGGEKESGRWLYDAASGEFTLLSKRGMPIYRLDDHARRKLNALAESRAASSLPPPSH